MKPKWYVIRNTEKKRHVTHHREQSPPKDAQRLQYVHTINERHIERIAPGAADKSEANKRKLYPTNTMQCDS